MPDEIDAREEIERFTEQNECEQNAKHGEKVHGKPLLLATEPQHDRADDEQPVSYTHLRRGTATLRSKAKKRSLRGWNVQSALG